MYIVVGKQDKKFQKKKKAIKKQDKKPVSLFSNPRIHPLSLVKCLDLAHF